MRKKLRTDKKKVFCSAVDGNGDKEANKKEYWCD